MNDLNISEGQLDATVEQLVSDSERVGLAWTMRPGTVQDDSTAILDGDTAPVDVVSLIGPIGWPLRVMVMLVPNGGNYAVGILGDPLTIRLYKSAAFSYANGAALVSWDGLSWDPWQMLVSSGTSQIRAPGTGKYNISVTLQFAANSTGTRSVIVRKNSDGSSSGGTAVVDVGFPAAAALATSVQCNVDVQMNQGDYLEVFSFQNTGGALNGIEGEHRTFVQVKAIH